ncbi:hypothetical protein CD126_03430 [Staphylococcus pettenkoferi]|nr:hypothetical protein CD126_03430 [Staphylococcus pettenkoferi]
MKNFNTIEQHERTTEMKRVLTLLFASILLVGCGHDNHSSKEDKSMHESSKKEDSQSKKNPNRKVQKRKTKSTILQNMKLIRKNQVARLKTINLKRKIIS